MPLSHLLEKLLLGGDLVVCDSNSNTVQQLSELVESEAPLRCNLFNHNLFLGQLPYDINKHVRCESLDLEMVQEDLEVDRVIVFVTLESQVLLEYIDIRHVEADIRVFQYLEELLVTDLLRTPSERLHVAREEIVLELDLIFEGLRHFQKTHVDLFRPLSSSFELYIVLITHEFIHHGIPCK